VSERIDVRAMIAAMPRDELETALAEHIEDISHLVDVIKERRPDVLGPGRSAIGAAIEIIEGVMVVSSMDGLARVGDQLLDRIVMIAMNIVIDAPWDRQPQTVKDAICMLFAMVRNRTAGVVPIE